MLFPTTDFLLFFAAVVALLALVQDRQRARKLVLCAASYVFYMAWDWRFGFLLLGSSVFTYIMGRIIAGGPRPRRWAVAAAVAVHLAVLCSFKYSDFLIGSVNQLLHPIGADLPFLGLILPVGISFFTFHGISYVVDVYRGDVAVCRRLDDMLLYIAFFPQLVAGPIVRAAFFLPQLYAPAPVASPLGPPLLLIAGGLVKKMLLATYIGGEFVDPVFFDPGSFSAWELVLASYGYAVQIYCDFSGYTDIAIGLAALLGYRFPPNFNQPYRSSSLQEFWRRWHISLSAWLRDYLYKPLGGSRNGPGRTVFALMATMLLGGLWHGPSWHFFVWGALHGAALVVERFARPLTSRLHGPWVKILATLLVFHFVCLTWVFFRADSSETALLYLRAIGDGGTALTQLRPFTLALVVAGLALQFAPPDWMQRLARRSFALPDWALAIAAGVAVTLIDALAPDGVAPFIYFQF